MCAACNAVMLKRTSSGVEQLLKSALLKGVFLTRAEVEKCMQAEKVEWPQKPRVLKPDLVDALLNKVLGEDVSAEEMG